MFATIAASAFGAPRLRRIVPAALACLLATAPADSLAATPAAGLELLLSKPYLPADFDQEVFDDLWTVWPEPLRSRAERAPVEVRRAMAMDRYGLLPHPDDPSRTVQYVVDSKGGWTMSCLTCHQGQVEGRQVPGLPNSTYALETLTEEVRLVKIRRRKAFGTMDMGSLLMPLGTTNGTTNAVIFGVALMRHRDAELAIVARPPRFDLAHHDMDAPAWWHYRRRQSLYADGFAPKGHRMLMQFLLVKENGPEQFHAWEEDFREIERWIESLTPPAWPGGIDRPLASRGSGLFATHCAGCHGTATDYPDQIIPLGEIGTDRLRLDALTAAERRDLTGSWFGHFGTTAARLRERESAAGYVAPPLDGIWATAPYFHNGSVPTLWHLLRPAERPVVWKRSQTGYDRERVGLAIEAFASLPEPLSPAERRTHFDTTRPGKARTGHDFADPLSEDEKTAILEYLKTL